jgi:uncharacterized NAD-dependent epimerase/dehydratase family protein
LISGDAVVYTGGLLDSDNAKTAHGLIRGGTRFSIIGVIDERHAGHSIKEFLPDRQFELPICGSIAELLAALPQKPAYCVVGVAFAGGRLPVEHRAALLEVIGQGIDLVSGLHEQLGADPEFVDRARSKGAEIIDIRQPRAMAELCFWTGEIYSVRTPKIAVLGTDCAIGKRTTAQLLVEACQGHGIRAEMIYTGQTGWMQGAAHGFILDATPNDFVSGELERCIVECAREAAPDLIVVEGQSSLQNPSGPSGSEILLSGNITGVVLQHVPGRQYFDGFEDVGCRLPDIRSEIDLIELYGANVLGITLNECCCDRNVAEEFKLQISEKLGIPVIDPLSEELTPLIGALGSFIAAEKEAISHTS